MNGEIAQYAGVLPRQYAPEAVEEYNSLIGRQTSWLAVRDMLADGMLPEGLVIYSRGRYYDVVNLGMMLRGRWYEQSLAHNMMGVRARA